jgi:hypothetical protein
MLGYRSEPMLLPAPAAGDDKTASVVGDKTTPSAGSDGSFTSRGQQPPHGANGAEIRVDAYLEPDPDPRRELVRAAAKAAELRAMAGEGAGTGTPPIAAVRPPRAPTDDCRPDNRPVVHRPRVVRR